MAGTRSSDLIAVFGVGDLGHLAIQYAAIAGARVVAVDMIDERLELVEDLGAEWVVNAARQDPVEGIRRLGGADQAIALAVPRRRSRRRMPRCVAAACWCSSRCRRRTR